MKAHFAEALHPSHDPADPADPAAGKRRTRLPASMTRAASALPGVLMPVILICMAQAVVVLAGELDLSVGAGISLINCALAGLPALAGWGTGATCLAAFAIALAAGVCNGMLVGYFRQSALIATFATSA